MTQDILLKRKPVYQLKITLQEVEPPIWRRVLVSGNVTLKTVHQVIQVAMGWTNTHLHQFEFDGEEIYSDVECEIETDPPPGDEAKTKLRKVAPSVGTRFYYSYDFGDGWEHEILVEDILPPGPSGRVPRCIGGERNCPPEDCGGSYGYLDFLKAVRNPRHKQHKEMLEWCGGSFDPEEFDIDEVNEDLQRLKQIFDLPF